VNTCVDALKTTMSKLKSRQITVDVYKELVARQSQLLNLCCVPGLLPLSEKEVADLLAKRNDEHESYKNFLKQVEELLKSSASFLQGGFTKKIITYFVIAYKIVSIIIFKKT